MPFDYIVDDDTIIAHKMNGVVIPAEREFPAEHLEVTSNSDEQAFQSPREQALKVCTRHRLWL